MIFVTQGCKATLGCAAKRFQRLEDEKPCHDNQPAPVGFHSTAFRDIVGDTLVRRKSEPYPEGGFIIAPQGSPTMLGGTWVPATSAAYPAGVPQHSPGFGEAVPWVGDNINYTQP